MAEPHHPSAGAPAARPFLPVLLVLFVGSGCSALIYEIVWLQLLQLVIGSSGVSLGVLLGTFMGGMCLGSLLLPRVVSARHHPLLVYALLELGIGAIGVLVLFGMPFIADVYTAYAVPGLVGILMRGVVSGVCLLPPTMLMGATLPAIARWVEATPRGAAWLGFFYGSNIAGAVFGCLLAGFYLLRLYDMATATYFAVAVNVLVAATGIALAVVTPYRPQGVEGQRTEDRGQTVVVSSAPGSWQVYVAIALSGLTAMGAEVVWLRLLALLLGGTVYTFSIILAVFLIGLGIGSCAGSFLARGAASPRLALGTCQMLLAAAIAWTALMIAHSLPYWPIDPSLSQSPWFTFQLDLVRCLWAVLPGACLWGASFPLAVAAVVADGRDAGRVVGGVYAANTVGAIVGSLAFSMLIIPWLGTQNAQRLLMALSAASALVVLVPAVGSARVPARAAGAVALLASVVVAGVLIRTVDPAPWGMIAYGRQMATWSKRLAHGITPEKDVPTGSGTPDVFCPFVGEGMNVSVAVTLTREGIRSFHGAGKVQASNEPQDMRLQRLLGHISALAVRKPESVLVVACGAGVTAGTFVLHPDVQRVVICDIEPLVPTKVTPMFGEENYHIVDGIAQQNPHEVNGKQVQVVYDDGRHFVRTTREKFDVITSDPIDPWVKGCAALNTVEYYTMCKEHLKPGGVMTLWIPLYESNSDTAKSVIATFFQVFPNAILWSNDVGAEGYDAVLFGQVEPTRIDVDEWQQRLDRPDHAAVAKSLRQVGFGSAVEMLATYAGHAPRLQEWVKGAQINTDRNLRLQYLAGMWLNSYLGKEILGEILRHYQFPDDVFVGSEGRKQALRQALDKAGRTAMSP